MKPPIEGKGLSREVFVTALRNSLKEIKSICSDVKCSFLFTKDGALIAEDAQTDDTVTMENAMHIFQSVAEKADTIGGLDTFMVGGDNGIVYISSAENMYLAMLTSKDADIMYLRSVTRVIVPTILKLIKSVVPTPLRFVPSLQLVVDNLGGFRSRIAGETVEVDHEILKQWSGLLDGKDVNGVEIEAFSGKRTQCRVRAIEDSRLDGKGLIRIPEKPFQALKVKKGELVRVKPIA